MTSHAGSRSRGALVALVVLGAALAGIASCSLLENVDDVVVGTGDTGVGIDSAREPEDAGVDARVSDAEDAAKLDAGADADLRWAQWRMPSSTPTNYAEDTPGIITDRLTGLRWQKTVTATSSFADATAACSALSLGGKAWRVPTRIELVSLLTLSRGVIPAINQTFFPSTPANKHWTSSTLESGGRYVVDFDSGVVTTAVGSELLHHRCVQAP